jgi:beta-galactosidase
MNTTQPPYIGADWYPEAFPPREMARDIELMQRYGVNLMRVNVFGWSRLEPREGVYDFGWLHRAVRALADAGIGVIMTTPTATPPAWLTEKYPEILRVAENGLRMTHGGRRHYCPNVPVYREYTRGITEKLLEEFAPYQHLKLWQIDNELGGDCFCDVCAAQFHRWLERRYGTVQALNEAWNLAIWSQEYQSFDQVPLPLPRELRAWHNPSLFMAYRNFISDSYTEYAAFQAEIIRRRTQVPVSTNAREMTINRYDYPKMFRELDIVTQDIYKDIKDTWKFAYEFDWLRPIKPDVPFWLVETHATWGGSLASDSNHVYYPGLVRAKMWLAFALGGETVMFWVWRAHWAGQEMEHGSLVYAWGDPTLAESEISGVCREMERYGTYLNTTRPVRARTAIHFSPESMWVFDHQPIRHGFNYDAAMFEWYRPFLDLNIERDVISPPADVSQYSVVFSPYLPVITDEFLQRMLTFVRAGGTWVVGPLSGFCTPHGTRHQAAALGGLELALGFHVRHRLPAPENGSMTMSVRGRSTTAELWCDCFEPGPGHRVTARYDRGPVKGMAAVLECPFGDGMVIVLGTLPDARYRTNLARKLCTSAVRGIVQAYSPGVVVVPRETRAEGAAAGAVVINLAQRQGFCTVRGKRIPLKPYAVCVVGVPV